MAHNWKAVAKHTGITVGEVGVIGFSTILTAKFIDARVLFKKQIEADPTYADKWYIKHQGALKLLGGAIGASMIKNPWLKMVFIGIALEGFITESVVLTKNKDTGVSFFDKIGASEDEINAEMMKAAQATNGVGAGYDEVSGYGDRYATAVSGYGDRYATSVSGDNNGGIDLNRMQASYVSGFR